MPLYTVSIEAGLLDVAGKTALAGRITDIHCEMAEVPRNWVHVIYTEYAPGHGFTGGEAAAVIALTVIIRQGRSPDYKRVMLERLGSALKVQSGATDEQIVLGIIEVPASQAMEMGKVMPDV